MVRLLLLLLVVALVLRRLLPRRRISWTVPLLVGVTVVAVRTATSLLAEDGPS